LGEQLRSRERDVEKLMDQVRSKEEELGSKIMIFDERRKELEG